MLSNLATSILLTATKVQEHIRSALTQNLPQSPAESPINLDYPGHLCCTFYDDENWGGETRTLCLEGDAEQSFHFDTFNDKTSSFYCG